MDDCTAVSGLGVVSPSLFFSSSFTLDDSLESGTVGVGVGIDSPGAVSSISELSFSSSLLSDSGGGVSKACVASSLWLQSVS